ncbi:unnamed protein product, partial [marine sediment metagenome]
MPGESRFDCHDWWIGIASIVNVLNPEMVILSGGMIAAGALIFKPVRR